ncbi:MAG: bifunctional phosphopantothenoylcysteine decarboxylase/phosphopantothenate--cysteine ligase CoaBC [Eudoraea sp.]|nr:bifunctional phosphopantothenoylcysteine decarboxylase/phosphopantothenate--cysteine ligase CoaBC [Eudoraea sp.]NNJ41532.1 bifunctional phosphopantothenoylcysteine decarboxylase/phosphopantothenate--cysteine ligase CoaBC [Eudoraea sp.]
MLGGKKILLGITGGIAAYKTTFLVRVLIKAGAEVRVIMTRSAGDFVSPLTLATLSKHKVLIDFIDREDRSVDWNNHVELGLWADFLLIAPATANTLSKMANGTCDNLLLATYLSAKCPVYFAPAMDLDMYRHPSTKATFETLQGFGNIMIPATKGELASGLHGEGRMAEPEEIIAFMVNHIRQGLPLTGKKVLITAGPTHEAIDPVRFIGNHATGRMGFELARAGADLGAEIVLITGPTHLKIDHPLIERISVVSAEDMYKAAIMHFKQTDIVIAAAAVADYRPKLASDQKIKKSGETMQLELVPNTDILLTLGQQKEKQFLVGFALETENELENAKAKIKKKNLDAIVLNSLQDEGAGFGVETNKITFIDKNFTQKPFELKTKAEVALDIWTEILSRLHA